MSTPARKRAWACACKAGPRLRRTRGQKLHAVAAQHRRQVALQLLLHAGAAQARALDEEGRVAHIPARQAGLGLGSRPALAWLTMHHTRQRARQPARAAEEQCSAMSVHINQPCHLSMGGPLLQRTAAVAGSGQRTALVSGSGLRRTRVPGARAARAPRAQRAPGAARTPVTRGGLRRCTSCSHGQHTDASAAAMLARALARSFALSWVPRAAVGSEEVYRVKVWYVCLLATPQLAGGLAQPRASASQRPRRTVCGARLLAELGFWVRAQLGGELSRGGPPCAHAVRRYKQDITNW